MLDSMLAYLAKDTDTEVLLIVVNSRTELRKRKVGFKFGSFYLHADSSAIFTVATDNANFVHHHSTSSRVTEVRPRFAIQSRLCGCLQRPFIAQKNASSMEL